jgi:hypothetical protein
MGKLLVCVIQTQKLTVRQKTLNDTLDKVRAIESMTTEVKPIVTAEVDSIDSNIIQKFVNLDKPKTDTHFDNMVRGIHVRRVSQALKHAEALVTFAQSDADVLLVLEDDVLTGATFTVDLAKAIEHIQSSDIDILSISSPVPSGHTDASVSIVDVFKFLPTCDAYLVSKKNIDTIAKKFIPIKFPANIQLSYVCMTNNLSMHLHIPNIAVNGSKFGVYLSYSDPNNKLFMNQDYNDLVSSLSKDIDGDTDQKVKKLMNNGSFNDHPDFINQFAMYHMKKKEYKEAQLLFQKAMNLYEQNECLLNNESEFLVNYSRVFKYLQDEVSF